MPAQRRDRFVAELGLPEYDAGVLVADGTVADFFESVVQQGVAPKAASNWVMTEVLRILSEQGKSLSGTRLVAPAFSELLKSLDQGRINRSQAKEVLEVLIAEGGSPADIIQARGMVQVSDTGALEEMASQVLAAHPGVVADFLSGKEAALQFLVGQVMKISRGKANPKVAMEILRKLLAAHDKNS